MMNKRGVTLIEALLAIFIVSVAIVALLEALHVGTYGTLDVSRKTVALNLAKSQMEYVKSQSCNTSIGDGNLSKVYGLINASDTGCIISGTVHTESTNLQRITVNISYSNGKQVQLIGFKNADLSGNLIYTPPTGWWAWQRAWTNGEVGGLNYHSGDLPSHPNSPSDFFGGYSYSLAAATTSEYELVKSLDSNDWRTDRTTTIGEVNTQLYTIVIAQPRLSIKNIQVTWRGHGGTACTVGTYPTYVLIFNYATGKWVEPSGWYGSLIKNEVNPPWTCNLTTNAADFVDVVTGNLSILASTWRCHSFSSSTDGMYTDYIGLNVTVAPMPIARVLQDDGINPLPSLAEAPFTNPLLARNTGITYQYNFSVGDRIQP